MLYPVAEFPRIFSTRRIPQSERGTRAIVAPFLDDAPSCIVNADGRFNFGRYRRPIECPDFSIARVDDFGPLLRRSAFLRAMRLKEWHYVSVVNDDWFLGFATAQLGYVCNVFLYLVDRSSGKKVVDYAVLSPLGWGLDFAPASTGGQTIWRHHRIAIRNAPDRWCVDVSLDLLKGTLEIERDECMALVHPLSPTRAAYTHKEAGNRVYGKLELAAPNRMIEFKSEASFATVDWTRSYANRITTWNWLSVAGWSMDGRRIGLNLSVKVYDAEENCFWVDGIAHPLPAARFHVPSQPAATRAPWHVEGAGIRLDFEPIGFRSENVQLGIIASKFVQMYGSITGTVQIDGDKFELCKQFGVAEDHYALW